MHTSPPSTPVFSPEFTGQRVQILSYDHAHHLEYSDCQYQTLGACVPLPCLSAFHFMFFTDIKVGVVSFAKPNKRGLSGLSALFIQWALQISLTFTSCCPCCSKPSNCIPQKQKLVQHLLGWKASLVWLEHGCQATGDQAPAGDTYVECDSLWIVVSKL